MPGYNQEKVFYIVGISELDAHIAAYLGYPEIQAEICLEGLAKARAVTADSSDDLVSTSA
jgi:hypothetical protein